MDENIPKNWITSSIEEICTKPQYGYTTKAVNNGNIKLLRTTDITSGKINWSTVPYCNENPQDPEKYLLKEGDIVISRAGSVGVSYLIQKPEKSIFASYLIRFNPLINRKFFKYFLGSPFYWNSISEKKLGIAIPNVNATKIKSIKLNLPPLSEQRAIVSKIEQLFSDLDNGIENFKKAQEQLKIYRQAVLKNACEGKLVPTEAELARNEGRDYEPADVLLARILGERREKWNGKGKYKEPVAPNTSGLAELPEGWCYSSLPQLGELARGKSKHRPRDDKRLFGVSYPFIQTGDVKKSNGFIKTYSQTYSEFGLAQSRLWPAGTLCITIAANIADSGILTFSSCFPDSVVGFISDESLCDVKFIELFVRIAKKDLEKYAPATAQKNINLNILQKVAVSLPPLAEQHRIVTEVERRLSVCDKMEETISQSLQKAESLRQSILKKAFEGKLLNEKELEEVRSAPDWEPAEKLLERIKAEKTNTKAEKKGKK